MPKNLTLSYSTTEAERKKLAKLSKSREFLQMMLDELKLIDLPCETLEDNSIATFIAGNCQVSKHTKHSDFKHHSSVILLKIEMDYNRVLCIRCTLITEKWELILII